MMENTLVKDGMKYDPNCVSEVSEPVEVIPLERICTKWMDDKRKELRMSYGLHKKTWCQEGLTAGFAFTPPGHKQIFHYHKQSHEFTMCLTGKMRSILDKGDSKESFEISPGEIVHIHPKTMHTVENPYDSMCLNASVHIPNAYADFTRGKITDPEFYKHAKIEKEHPEISEHDWGTIYHYDILNNDYRYCIDFLFVEPGKTVELGDSKDSYIFVPKGTLEVDYDEGALRAEKNQLIVAEKDRRISLKNISSHQAYLYRVYENN